MGKEAQLLEASAAGNLSKVEASQCNSVAATAIG